MQFPGRWKWKYVGPSLNVLSPFSKNLRISSYKIEIVANFENCEIFLPTISHTYGAFKRLWGAAISFSLSSTANQLTGFYLRAILALNGLSTWKALGGTQSLGHSYSTRRALGHIGHSDTKALGALGHLGTYVTQALRHSGT